VLALAAMAACSSGGGTKSAKATGETIVTVPSPTVAAGAPKAASEGATTSTTQAPDLTLTSFKSPSSNIGCEVVPDVARCDIREHTWAVPPKPASCDLDWGQGIQMSGSTLAQFVCAGDTALDPASTVLAYGQRARQGSFVCESAAAGVTCTNEATAHGFFLSRDSYRIF